MNLCGVVYSNIVERATQVFVITFKYMRSSAILTRISIGFILKYSTTTMLSLQEAEFGWGENK